MRDRLRACLQRSWRWPVVFPVMSKSLSAMGQRTSFMIRVAAAGLQTSNEYFLSTRGCAHFECGARHKFKLWRGVGVPRVAAWRAGGACGQCHGLACGSGNGRLGVRLWRVAKGVASRGVRFGEEGWRRDGVQDGEDPWFQNQPGLTRRFQNLNISKWN